MYQTQHFLVSKKVKIEKFRVTTVVSAGGEILSIELTTGVILFSLTQALIFRGLLDILSIVLGPQPVI